MDFNFFNSSFSSKMIQAFSWTLIHSLWQGLILAILTGIVLFATKRTSPALRYNVLAGLLAFFVLVSVVTFWLELKDQAVSGTITSTQSHTLFQELTAIEVMKSNGVLSFDKFQIFNWLMDFIAENSIGIVAIWFLVFLMKSLKATFGLYYIYHIRNHKIVEVDIVWKQKLQQLTQRLKIRKTILLFESELVTVPIVAGFVKPMILVPIGFLTNLPFSQIEAILLHELAHVKRKDYLVNLFQSFAENIFFFNPAVLWISYLIKEEREHCCDDLAISITQNKKSFIHALVLFQDYKMNGVSYTDAFPGKRNHLLDRVKRIIYNNNKQLDAMEKSFVTASLIIVAALSFAFSSSPLSGNVETKTGKNKIVTPTLQAEILKDTVPLNKIKPSSSSTSTIHVTRNNKRYEIEEKDGKISELKIDGSVIPADRIDTYKPEIESILAEIKEQHERAEVSREEAEKYKIEAEKYRQEADIFRKEAGKNREIAEEYRVQAEQLRKQAEQIRIDSEKQRNSARQFRAENDQNRGKVSNVYIQGNPQLDKNSGQFAKQAEVLKSGLADVRIEAMKSEKETAKFRENAEVFRVQADEIRRHAVVVQDHAVEIRKQAEIFRDKAEVFRRDSEKTRFNYESMQAELISDLVSEGVIKNKSDFSYKLSDQELIVDGVKQPENLFKKIKGKYLKESGTEILYNYKGKTGYTITGTVQNK